MPLFQRYKLNIRIKSRNTFTGNYFLIIIHFSEAKCNGSTETEELKKQFQRTLSTLSDHRPPGKATSKSGQPSAVKVEISELYNKISIFILSVYLLFMSVFC